MSLKRGRDDNSNAGPDSAFGTSAGPRAGLDAAALLLAGSGGGAGALVRAGIAGWTILAGAVRSGVPGAGADGGPARSHLRACRVRRVQSPDRNAGLRRGARRRPRAASRRGRAGTAVARSDRHGARPVIAVGSAGVVRRCDRIRRAAELRIAGRPPAEDCRNRGSASGVTTVV